MNAMGKERLTMVFGYWLAMRKKRVPIGMPPGRTGRDEAKSYVERLEDELARTKEIVELYRQMERMDRRRRPQKQPSNDSRDQIGRASPLARAHAWRPSGLLTSHS